MSTLVLTLLAVSAIEPDPPTKLAEVKAGVAARGPNPVETLWDLFRQNRQSFATLRVRSEWSVTIPREARESSKRMADYLRHLAGDPSRKFTPIDRGRFRDEIARCERDAAQTDAVPETWQYTVAPEGLEALRYLPTSDPRMRAGKSRGLTTFTGGDFTIYRFDGHRWNCLDPYPYLNAKAPVGYTMTELPIYGMLPPLVQAKHFRAELYDALVNLWDLRDRMRPVGRLPREGGGPLELIAVPGATDVREFWLIAYDPAGHGLASWVTRWWVITPSNPDSLRVEIMAGRKGDLVRRMTEQAQTLRGRWAVDRIAEIVPVEATYWESPREIADAGWYPMLVRQHRLGPVRRSDTTLKDDPYALPIGHLEDRMLTIREVAANFDAPRSSFAMEFAKGTTLLDMDTRVGSIVGQTTDDSLRAIVPIRKLGRWRSLSLIINAVLLAVVGTAFYLLRRRQATVAGARPESPNP